MLKILKYKLYNSYFEIILVTINDELVNRYLKNQISYISIHKSMLILLKKPYFAKFYKTSPKNINDVKIMVKKVKVFLNDYFKKNDQLH